MRKSLTKEERIKKSNEIYFVFSKGKKVSCNGARLLWIKNGLSYNRLAVSLVKKFGNAVKRNKEKRRIREIYRTEKFSLNTGHDIVMLLFSGDFSFQQRKKQFEFLVKKAGLKKDKSGVIHG